VLDAHATALDNACSDCPNDISYVWHLARNLGATPMSQWLRDQDTWPALVNLAFSYLDVDADGLLGGQDIAEHVSGPRADIAADVGPSRADWSAWAAAMSRRWALRWRGPGTPGTTTGQGHPGLSLADFRGALLASWPGGESAFDAFDVPPAARCGRGPTGKPRSHLEEEITWDDLTTGDDPPEPAGKSGGGEATPTRPLPAAGAPWGRHGTEHGHCAGRFVVHL